MLYCASMTRLPLLQQHVAALLGCARCPDMIGPVVSGLPVDSSILLVGQAPGPHEGRLGRPFAWTAGKTMFGWFASIGLPEAAFREQVYMAAVCRCFPGKNPRGGDRVPAPAEIAACGEWLAAEVRMLRPTLIVPVGKLAIAQLVPVDKLDQIVGRSLRATLHGHTADVIPLPHPSGASTWHRTEPGKTLLGRALATIEQHPAWRQAMARAKVAA
jgi:uracil-DNA glycosylase